MPDALQQVLAIERRIGRMHHRLVVASIPRWELAEELDELLRLAGNLKHAVAGHGRQA